MSPLRFSYMILTRRLLYFSSQKWNRKRIEQYQDKQLIAVVQQAARHVPYYRHLFKKIGFDAAKFRGRIDMPKIPLLDKETLRTRQSEFIADNAQRFGIHWDSTSGSTGTPLHLIIDHSTKAHKLAAVIRSYQWGGYFPGIKIFSIQSYTFDNPKAIFKRYAPVNLWRFNAKILSKDNAIEILRMINTIKPDMLIGFPFSIYTISRFAQKAGISVQPVKSIVTAGETLSVKKRRLLEKAYGCEVFDFYSLHENVVIISECKHHTKHLCEDFAYNEIVNENGEDATQNRAGEIVGTGLYNYAMPLIRYKIGDTVVLDQNNHQCQCGSVFKSIKEIVGRQNDYIVTPDGRYLGNVLEHSVDQAKGVMMSQCIQDRLNHLYVNLVVDDLFSDDSTDALEKGLRLRLGNEIKIDFKIVDELEKKQNGKTPFIYSKVGNIHI